MPLIRRSFLGALLCALAVGGITNLMAASSSHTLFLGTYSKNGSEGIYTVRLDAATGALSAPALVAKAPDPAWIVLSPDKRFLYALSPTEAQAAGYAVSVSPTAATLTPLSAAPAAAANPPSHLAVDATGHTLVAANYREGFVASIPLRADGTLGTPRRIQHTGKGPDPKRQEAPHVHSVTISADNHYVAVCDLGLDKIFSYKLDAEAGTLAPATPPYVTTPAGYGPRHFKFSNDSRHAYAITEMGGTVEAFDYDAATGALKSIQSISSLPAGFNGLKWGAEVRVHPNGKFLYASNRTHDSIAVFAIAADTGLLTLVEIVPSGGKTPRNFALSPDGNWLVCGHQDEPIVTVFKVDAATGRLTATPNSAAVPMCVCVVFYD